MICHVPVGHWWNRRMIVIIIHARHEQRRRFRATLSCIIMEFASVPLEFAPFFWFKFQSQLISAFALCPSFCHSTATGCDQPVNSSVHGILCKINFLSTRLPNRGSIPQPPPEGANFQWAGGCQEILWTVPLLPLVTCFFLFCVRCT